MQLEERTKDWSFETFAFLRMYTTYINNYTQAVYTFQRLQPNFAQMVEGPPRGIKLSFQDYQIMPVQRIPRYVRVREELNYC
ncbi:guanine exchange factor for rac 30, putative [Acanthamoeba castellanii str. Neff]|uniref:Guanine exchange factor for rac 30, putative n=1 Tax=Acanthamoeba castellanii (strain ATCC 30010 / Neff) TaxID=1257118 RepID=L8H5N8_ACACF|nr:guanine exchange factor for rac 30, putative [Acanthamoeba castellanii str. Neff]ELR20480.1 guanine exchange factor for rac 30, putative [Acanthamoeba castellanii str. Neff]